MLYTAAISLNSCIGRNRSDDDIRSDEKPTHPAKVRQPYKATRGSVVRQNMVFRTSISLYLQRNDGSTTNIQSKTVFKNTVFINTTTITNPGKNPKGFSRRGWMRACLKGRE